MNGETAQTAYGEFPNFMWNRDFGLCGVTLETVQRVIHTECGESRLCCESVLNVWSEHPEFLNRVFRLCGESIKTIPGETVQTMWREQPLCVKKVARLRRESVQTVCIQNVKNVWRDCLECGQHFQIYVEERDLVE